MSEQRVMKRFAHRSVHRDVIFAMRHRGVTNPDPGECACRDLAAHAAMKYLVPLARANAAVATQFAQAITPLKPTSREIGALYAGWQSGTERTRELILASPQVYLQAQATQEPAAPSATQLNYTHPKPQCRACTAALGGRS